MAWRSPPATRLVTNLGTIEATDASGQPPSGALVVGASLAGGGTVYNGFTASAVVNSAAVTSGADYGVLVQGSAGAVINSGTISGKVAINFNSVAGVVLDNGAITSTDGAAGTRPSTSATANPSCRSGRATPSRAGSRAAAGPARPHHVGPDERNG